MLYGKQKVLDRCVKIYEGEGHAFLNYFWKPAGTRAYERILKYLDRNLKKQEAGTGRTDYPATGAIRAFVENTF